MARKDYAESPRPIRVLEGILLFRCPDGGIALYPEHIEILGWKSSRTKLETALTFLAKRTGFERRPLPSEFKMHDVVAVLPGSRMAAFNDQGGNGPDILTGPSPLPRDTPEGVTPPDDPDEPGFGR